MKRFVEGVDRSQGTLFPDRLEDWIDDDNTVRVIDAFVDELDLGALGFSSIDPRATGRPAYHPSVLLKLHIYGYLNRVRERPSAFMTFATSSRNLSWTDASAELAAVAAGGCGAMKLTIGPVSKSRGGCRNDFRAEKK